MIFTRDDSSNFLLINAVQKLMPVSGVVIESGGTQARIKLLRRRFERLGFWVVLDQLLYLFVRAFLTRLGAYPSRLTVPKGGLQDMIGTGIKTLRVKTINSPEVSALVRELKPAIIIVSGTGIIGKELIDSFSGPIINYHAGITPEYRGVYGGFWAIYEGRPDLAGGTVHLIDPGIDTGGILKQSAVSIDLLHDQHLSILEKQFELGIKLITEVITEFQSGRKLEGHSKPAAKSGLYSHPGLSHLIRFWLKTGMR